MLELKPNELFQLQNIIGGSRNEAIDADKRLSMLRVGKCSPLIGCSYTTTCL